MGELGFIRESKTELVFQKDHILVVASFLALRLILNQSWTHKFVKLSEGY